MNDATNHPLARPRWLRLQFSLRLLLVAFTAFAIGFPIWYRWPYEETVVNRFPTGPVDAPTGQDQSTTISTWQRQWGGTRVKHGPERSLFHDAVYITPYVHGQRQGTYTFHDGHVLRGTGPYVDNRKDGTWVDVYDGNKATINWHRDKLDGLCQWQRKNGDCISADYSMGRMTHFNGEPFHDHLFRLRETDSIDVQTAAELHQIPNIFDLVGIPLKDFVEMVTMLHPVSIWIDPQTVASGNLTITGGNHGMDLGTFLTLRLAPVGLACDYRYGRLWITTVKDVQNWRDATGVADIQPPAASSLARAWNEPAVAAVTTSPLAEVLAAFAKPLRVTLDTTRIDPTPANPSAFPTVSNTSGLPFRHALGILLSETGCRCRLEGEKLVILPPETGP
jgi:hypothetical protein